MVSDLVLSQASWRRLAIAADLPRLEREMDFKFAAGIMLALGAGAFVFYLDPLNPDTQGDAVSGSDTGESYVPSAFYAKCETDYLQSASHLGFSASKSDCECFDEKLQKLTPAQQSAAYKSLEDRLTLAFMGKAGAEVQGSNVSFQDKALGDVSANVKIETSGRAIMAQCSMF